MFEANVFQCADLRKSGLLMDFQRSLIIAFADDSDQLPITLRFSPAQLHGVATLFPPPDAVPSESI